MSESTPSADAGFRLSPQQRRLWALVRGAPRSPHRALLSASIEGDLDPALLASALADVAARHEVLRTTFTVLPGMTLPVQVVRPEARPPMDVHDLSGLPEEERERGLEALDRELAEVELPPGEGPLLRGRLIRMAPRDHRLRLVASALCADAHTLENVARELAAACARRAGGAGPEPSAEIVQYSDVAEVLNDLLESHETEAGRRIWAEVKPPEGGPATLPAEGADASAAGCTSTISCAVPITPAMVNALAAQSGTSAEVALLACWQVLLSRLTGRRPFLIGLALGGRTYEGLDEAMGPYERHVPVRVNIDWGGAVASAARDAERAIAEARELQDCCPPPAGEAAAFAFGYAFRDAVDIGAAPAPGFCVEASSSWTERYDAQLTCVCRRDRWEVKVHGDAARITKAQAARLAEGLAAMVASAAARPGAAVGALDALGEAERRAVLIDFNRTARAFPIDRAVHELFEEQARRHPERAAAVHRGRSISYAELNERADRLARRLRGLGVGPEARVGLHVERSPEAIVAIFGILKAGAAYVPLDPLYPPERIAFMKEDAGLSALITETALREALQPGAVPTLCVDAPEPSEPGLAPMPPVRVSPGNLAYVIYTSGSTGRPKGVMIEHRSVVNLAGALAEAIYEGSEAPLRVSLNASLSFDASVKQWVTLLLGHTLCIVPEEARGDPGKLAAFARDEALDVLDCTPAQLRGLLDRGLAGRPEAAPGRILAGGEPIDERTWRELAGLERPRLYNVYGPTECTVDATACEARRAPRGPTIGGPLANVRVHVLDERGAPTPIGVPGELHIGGAGVARGYLGRPALTASRFIPDPFGEADAGARLYRTGDAARWLPDGRLELLGRLDDQVKIRGFRIELGEIEAAIAAHPAVARAVVAVRERAPGERHLVGYFVPREGGGEQGLVGGIRDFLRTRLPEFMVPWRLMAIPAVPLSTNGKVDRAALPAPPAEVAEGSAPEADEAPRTEVERRIAAIWQEVLGVPRVGLHQNFFDLGGHSLLLVQVFDRLRASFGEGLSMTELLRHPTVSAMAERLSQRAEAPRSFADVEDRARRQLAARERQRRGRGGRG